MEKIKVRKALQQRNSAEIVASIDDILIEILLRLPIISLVRFESVSKHWQSLITNLRFCHLRNRSLGLMLPRGGDKSGQIYEYVPFFDNAFEYHKCTVSKRISQSCNGLLLYISYCHREHIHRYYVCNPTSNQLSMVPRPQLEDDNYFIRGMSLAFDPAMSPHYKVVCVLKLGIRLFQILIYSSETSAWGVCGEPFTYSDNNFVNGVYWDGAIHWMSRKIPLYFKTDNQVLDEMPRVPFSNGWNRKDRYYFGESCDHLHFVETRDTQIQLNVYVMKRDYSEWIVKYQVDLSPVVTAYPEMIRGHTNPRTSLCYYDFSVFCIVSVGKEEDESILVLQIPTKVLCLNLVHKTLKNLYEFKGDYGCRWGSNLKFPYKNGYQYIESLCHV